MTRIWEVPAADVLTSIDEVERALLGRLGLGSEHIDRFFQPQYGAAIHDPFAMWQMEAAVERIEKAVADKERILIYGDYDMDGVSAVAVLLTVLQEMGAHVTPFLPHRMDDGYGLNQEALEQMIDEFDLLITVDCGISNANEVAWLRERGKDVIVSDHHEIPEQMPEALAVLHPRHPQGNYPWGQLAGAGVAWKLAQALVRRPKFLQAHDQNWEKWLLDLPLLGTVGDMMPLLDENRALVQFGMEVLRRTRRPGLSVMLDRLNLSRAALRVENLSFRMIPLFNAAGRIDHPQAALDVLLATTKQQALRSVEALMELNKQRQAITRKMAREAEGQLDLAAPVLFAYNISWPAGVVGLVAGQLARKFGRPAVVVGGNGRHAVGSARSVEGVDILQGLRRAEQFMVKLGGHSGAAGFSVVEEQVTAMHQEVVAQWQGEAAAADAMPPVRADGVLSDVMVGWDLWRMLEKFSPFGSGNGVPKFVIKQLHLEDMRPVGKDGKHAKFTFSVEGRKVGGIGFGHAEGAAALAGTVDVVAEVDVNEFRGRADVQLRIDDIARAGEAMIVKNL